MAQCRASGELQCPFCVGPWSGGSVKTSSTESDTGGAKLLLPPWHLQSPSCWTCLPLTLYLMGLAMKGMKDKGNHLLLFFVHVSHPPLKTFVHWNTEILRIFLTHSSIYTFTVPWCEVGNRVGCLRYSVQCSEHSCEQGFSFKKTWRWLYCILAVKLFFLC